MAYVQRKFYFPEEMYMELTLAARAARQPITQTLRDVVAQWLARRQKTRGSQGARMLLELAKLAERGGWKGPRDLAKNHDKYLGRVFVKDLKRIHDQYR